MNVKYQDPWKDDKYGKLKGDKAEDYFKINFNEAQIHKTDDAYIIAGNVTAYQGIVRAYKPEQALTPGLCAIPIYGKEYEIRKKDFSGNWISEAIQPSKFEKALYEYIESNEDDFIPHNGSVKGEISHIPNGMCASMDEAALTEFVEKNVEIEVIDSSGTLPEYKAPTAYTQRKNYSGAKSVAPDEKLEFIKKQLALDIKDVMYKANQELGDLTEQLMLEHKADEAFLDIYFQILIACVR